MNELPHYRMYIDGQWRDAETSIEVASPATGAAVATVAYGDLGAVEDAIAAAKSAHDIGLWRNMSAHRRLSAGVWSVDPQRALAIARRLETGTVWVNDWHMINARYPFGGVKQSGLGRELGPGALDEYTEPKFTHVDMTNDPRKRIYGVVVSEPARTE